MKRITQILAFTSFVLNGAYLILWINTFKIFDTHQQRLEYYHNYIPEFMSLTGFYVFLIALTILAIGLLLAHRRNLFLNIILAFEFLFLVMYAWGLL